MPPPSLGDLSAAERLDDEALLAAVQPYNAPSRARRALRPVRLAIDAVLPPELRAKSLEVRRRARFVVVMTLLALPAYGVLIQQLLASGLVPQAITAAVFGLVTLLSPLLLRVLKSHIVPGTIVCVLLATTIFVQASTDAGLHDPILFWSALVPLAAALSVGPRLSVACALINVVGISTLYGLTLAGYQFPNITPRTELDTAAFASVFTATLFALLWGWFYEAHTLRELKALNGGLTRLREALARSEERYQALFENVPLGVYRTTPDGRVLMANPALVSMLGYASTEELRTMAPETNVYVDDSQRQRFREIIEADGEVQQFAALWRCKDGRRVHVRENARAVFDKQGNALYYEGTVEDVTAQRRVQQALRKSEERFRSLVQNASDITAVLDRLGQVTYLSPSSERILGYSAADLAVLTPFEVVHAEDRHRMRVLFRRAFSQHGDLGTTEFRVLHANGHYVYVEAVGANMARDQNIGGLVLNLRDVTERKRAEAALLAAKEQAEEIARLKSAFLANMSHEIRTPLTGILGFAGVLGEEVTDPQQREFVALIEKSGNRLMETLNSVLELARLEAGRVNLDKEPHVLADAVEETVRLMQPMARKAGLSLVAHVRDHEARASVDRAALDRILGNLVGNAIKFTEEGGVTVEVDADEQHAIVRVRDTGVGIDPEFLPRLFNEFEQESTGIGRSHEGAGLGLSLSRQLTEHMGGTIEVESKKGNGSTFIIQFPSVGAPDAQPTLQQPPDPSELPRVLVVDDNANTRMLMKRMMRDVYAVEAVGTAEEAMALAEATVYDAVLLDINLGATTSGEDIMHSLREMDAYVGRPILAFTAYALPGDRERFLNAGFDGYLPKPFTKPQLVEQLDRLMVEAEAEQDRLIHPEVAVEQTLIVAGPRVRRRRGRERNAALPAGSGDGATTETQMGRDDPG